MGAPWSSEDTKRLEQLVKESKSLPQLCEILGRSRWSVITKTRQMNLKVTRVSTRRAKSVAPDLPPATRRPPIHQVPPRLSAKDLYFARMIPVLSDEHRPWETRVAGECAAPVTMENGEVHSCCRPVYQAPKAQLPSSYCREHHRIFFYPVQQTKRDLARARVPLRP